jgi:hypothetical protein
MWIQLLGSLKLEQADHYVLALEGNPFRNLSASFEGYYKSYNSLVLYNRNKIDSRDPDYINGLGKAYGFESLLRYGTPVGVEFFVNVFAFNLFVLLMQSYGPSVAAAVTITFNWDLVAFIPMLGVGAAVTSLACQRVGAGDIAGARRAAQLGLRIAWAWAGLNLWGSLTLNEGSPGEYSTSPCSVAFLRRSSASEAQGTTFRPVLLSASMLAGDVGRSALFAATREGFVSFRVSTTNRKICSSVHVLGFSVLRWRCRTTCSTSAKVTESPESLSARCSTTFPPVCSKERVTLSQSFFRMPNIHRSNSRSTMVTSPTGSWEPGGTFLPSTSVDPEASTT